MTALRATSVAAVKLLMGATLDVFIDSPGFRSTPHESTQFVEAFWRRREPIAVEVHPPLVFLLAGASGRRHRAAVMSPMRAATPGLWRLRARPTRAVCQSDRQR